jgi:chorismate mutase
LSQLAGRRALITGAGGALGRASSLLFAREGAEVVVLDFVAEAAEETARLVREEGGTATPVVADVADEEQVRRAVGEAVDALGGLDLLFNNAGIMPHQDVSLLDADVELWRSIMGTNLHGAMLCAKYGVPHIAAAGGGSVVNMSSFLAVLGCSVPQDAYAASKGAIASLTPLHGRPVRGPAYPRQRARPGAHPHAARRAVLPGSGGARAAPRAGTPRTLRDTGGRRVPRLLPGLGRRLMAHRPGRRPRRRHLLQLPLTPGGQPRSGPRPVEPRLVQAPRDRAADTEQGECMAVRAIRGATQVDADDREQVLEATRELVTAVMERNELQHDDVISILFTATPDLVSEFPALAARELGFGDVPLMCATEIDVPHALPRVLRLMAHVDTDRPRSEIQHVYLRGAVALRRDIAQ